MKETLILLIIGNKHLFNDTLKKNILKNPKHIKKQYLSMKRISFVKSMNNFQLKLSGFKNLY